MVLNRIYIYIYMLLLLLYGLLRKVSRFIYSRKEIMNNYSLVNHGGLPSVVSVNSVSRFQQHSHNESSHPLIFSRDVFWFQIDSLFVNQHET